MIYIVMGVSSSGKSLIGQKLAEKMELPFFDADEYHPPSNIRKMESGKPLNDDDRRPWLDILASEMEEWQRKHGGAVLACSALKKSYRDRLSPPSVPVIFIYLKGSKELIASRMKGRVGHFMPESLLDSQFEALEEPPPSEALHVTVDREPEEIITEILEKLPADEH